MKVSLYLHRNVYDLLTSFGELSEVINKILELGEQGKIDILDRPDCGSREGASRYNVDIHNDYFLKLQNQYGINSHKCSLRRLVYWFINYEIFVDFGWEVHKLIKTYNDKVMKSLNNIIDECYKIRRYLKGYDTELSNISEAVSKIKGDLDNGKLVDKRQY